MSRFSLPWVRETSSGALVAFDYAIRQVGNTFELRYREVLIHTAADVAECQAEADRHRGISRPRT